MKKKIAISIVCLLFLVCQHTNAQYVAVEYKKSDLPSKATRYKNLIEKNLKYAKIVYQVINLDSSENNMLLGSPVKQKGENQNLIDILMTGIEAGTIKAYDPLDGYFNEFNSYLTFEGAKYRLGAIEKTIETEGPDGTFITKKIQRNYNSNEIQEYIVKELRFYDKSNKLVQTRVLGLCPIRYYYAEEDADADQEKIKKEIMFWVYYPEIKPLLAAKMRFKDEPFDQFFVNQQYDAKIQRVQKVVRYDMIEDDGIFPIPLKSALLEAENHYQANDNLKYQLSHAEEHNCKQYPKIDKSKAVSAKYVDVLIDTYNTKSAILSQPYYEMPNFPYFSLIDILMGEVEKGVATYTPDDSTFSTLISFADIMERFGAVDEAIMIETETGELVEKIIKGEYDANEATAYVLRELQILDNTNKILYSKVIALCPKRRYFKDDDINWGNPVYKKLFWIKYTDIRKELSNRYLYAEGNVADKTFDEYFYHSEYKGEIYKEQTIDLEDAIAEFEK